MEFQRTVENNGFNAFVNKIKLSNLLNFNKLFVYIQA